MPIYDSKSPDDKITARAKNNVRLSYKPQNLKSSIIRWVLRCKNRGFLRGRYIHILPAAIPIVRL